jgi:hypothetical protein
MIPLYKVTTLVVALVASTPSTAKPQTDRDAFAKRLLASARTVRCSFSVSTLTRLDSLPPKTERNAWKSADLEEIVFDQIDRLHHTAREIGNAGAGSVDVISSQDVLSFVEVSPSANPIVYTIFARLVPGTADVITAPLLAVVSSHIMGFHDVIATQDYGGCRVVPG